MGRSAGPRGGERVASRRAHGRRHALPRRDADREPRGRDPPGAARAARGARGSTPRTRGARARSSIATGSAPAARSLHAHNEGEPPCARCWRSSRRGSDVALVSDAGTPLLSDPGERLVAAAVAGGPRRVPDPGRLGAAVGARGLRAPDAALPLRRLPAAESGERRARFAELAARRETLVLFESPRRVGATLAELAAALGAGAPRLPGARADEAPRELRARHPGRARRALRRGRAGRGDARRRGMRRPRAGDRDRISNRRSARPSARASPPRRPRARWRGPSASRGATPTPARSPSV